MHLEQFLDLVEHAAEVIAAADRPPASPRAASSAGRCRVPGGSLDRPRQRDAVVARRQARGRPSTLVGRFEQLAQQRQARVSRGSGSRRGSRRPGSCRSPDDREHRVFEVADQHRLVDHLVLGRAAGRSPGASCRTSTAGAGMTNSISKYGRPPVSAAGSGERQPVGPVAARRPPPTGGVVPVAAGQHQRQLRSAAPAARRPTASSPSMTLREHLMSRGPG